jgi:Tol biopolymer transport system component
VTVAPGTRLGPYEITARLGAGGMGEVWRATDARLRREVAVKVLPALFTSDRERLARFEREAQLLAQLQHPNIAAVYGLEQADGVRALVMELVDGEDLAAIVSRGALALDEALPIARQIAEALEAAHEQGIVHRDLKPANVKVRADGAVKVLDFGLAKAMGAAVGSSAAPAGGGVSPELLNSPTLTSAALAGGTELGVILGTAAYMAPEQARGGAVDKRADIWAFGVVLFEMLTGRSLFAGETVSDTLAEVLKTEVDFAQLPASTPEPVRQLLRRCLERNPRNRLRDIGDARLALEDAIAHRGERERPAPPQAVSRGPLGRWLPWVGGGLAGLTVGVLVAGLAARLLAPKGEPAAAAVVMAEILPPPGAGFDLRARGPGPVAFSPDGTRVAFAAQLRESATRLYVRTLGDGRLTEYPGTEGAQYPFWSPDGRWVAFFSRADGMLRKVPVEGGTPLTICRALNGKGGSWGRDDVILIAPSSGVALHRVSAAGGEPEPVTTLVEPYNSHRHPRFLPDGRRFLFLARSSQSGESRILLGSLDGTPPREVIRSATQAELASGHLLFVRESVLMAQPFDLEAGAVTGEAVPIADEVLELSAAALAAFSASLTGRLAFHAGQAQGAVPLEIRDRRGQPIGELGTAGTYRSPAFSPDGKWIATTGSPRGLEDNSDVWLFDLEGGRPMRFTVAPEEEVEAIWAPDGGWLYFGANRAGPHDILRKSLAGAGAAELVFGGAGLQTPTGISRDGRLLFVETELDERTSVAVVDLATRRAQPLRDGTSNDSRAAPSPDGRWLLFTSDETGRPEVYVTPFPGPGRSWPVSTAGGRFGAWRADGREIVYIALDGRILAVPAMPDGDSFRLGAAAELFRTTPPTRDYQDWGMSPDAERFAIVRSGVAEAENRLRLIVNWTARLAPR